MSERKAILILHGKQASNEEVRTAVERYREQGNDLAVRLTWEGGDAQRLVEEALQAGYTHIIAGGGDGTLRDVAEAMALAKTDASLVLMPLGTANDFARAAGVPLEPEPALALLAREPQAIDLGEVGGQVFLNMATGGFGSQVTANDFARAAGVPLEPEPALALLAREPQAIDLGEVGGQVFLNMATGGFGSQVTANTSEDLKKVLGGAAYLFTGLSRFSELRAASASLSGPDFHWEGDLLALGIGNGRQAGGGHELCPEAVVDDGLLEISILPAPTEVVGTLKSLLGGGGLETLFVRARLPWVEINSKENLDINLDGEPLQGENLRFSAMPKALKVHLPAGSPLLSRRLSQ